MTHNICFILLAVDKENNNDPLKIWWLGGDLSAVGHSYDLNSNLNKVFVLCVVY